MATRAGGEFDVISSSAPTSSRRRASASIGRPVRRVAVVEPDLDPVGDDVRGDPALRSGSRSAPRRRSARRPRPRAAAPRRRARAPRTARSIALTPVPGPRRVGALAVERQRRVEVAEAARVDRVVGRLEHDHEVGLEHQRRLGEDAREGALLGGAAPRARRRGTRGRAHVASSAAQRASSIITATPPFMSLAPRPITRPSSIRPGMLSWAGTVSRWPASRTSGALRALRRVEAAPRRCRRRAESARRRRRARGGPPPRGSARRCRSARACGERGPRPGG